MEAATDDAAPDLGAMKSADVEALARQLDSARRVAEATMAQFLQRAEAAGVHHEAGFRQVAGWGRGACNWSGAEAHRLAKLGRAFARLPLFAQACLQGAVPVSAMHAVAAVAANPRVAIHLAEADAMFTEWARTRDADDLAVLLHHWAELADEDGARSRHDRAMNQRNASIGIVGERAYLDASGPAADGLLLREVFERFLNAEWQTDWQVGTDKWGDDMAAHLLQRTHAQRSFDALVALFRAAAGSRESGGGVTVNVVVDQQTFERHLAEAMGGDVPQADPSMAAERRCQSDRGELIDPRAMVVAALLGHVRRLVLGGDGVVLDFGRRKRLFTGPLREAVLLSHRWCVFRGCGRPSSQCEADHVHPFAPGGATSVANGAPLCDVHNRWKNRGWRVWRDPDGLWHTFRPDGTEFGWPVQYLPLDELRPDAVRLSA